MRVIAGFARGRPLRAAEGTRPTADLHKGAMFSMLEALAYKRGFEPDDEGRLAAGLAWPRVLDLFAGSGALGIEALSRGADWAEFIDSDRDAVRVIESNLRAMGFDDRARVHTGTIESALKRVQGPIDLVFADPPYAETASLDRALDAFARSGLARESTVLVVEQPSTSTPSESIGGVMRLSNTRRHGRTKLSLYTAEPPASEHARTS